MRRSVWVGMALGALAGLTGFAQTHSSSKARAPGFVRVEGTRFTLDGAPYRFLGANFWYGMNLGSEGASGDRARLERELDRLKGLGVTNLRIFAASEGPDSEPWRIVPALQSSPGIYREELLRGLDFLLDQMRARGMRAVVCLNNFWPWSGGMSQYLAWNGAGAIPYPPPQPGGDWNTYQAYTQQFYSNGGAVAASRDAIRTVVSRVNALSGMKYSEDPAVMAWQLANEPRGVRNVDAFNRWIDETAGYIKSLDPNHLVTTGSEGETPWPESSGLDLIRNHSSPNIDYATAHVWVQNWNFFDPARADDTFGPAVDMMRKYLQAHADKAARLGKPLVLEEFGLARDGGSYDPAASTSYRDRYFSEVFGEVLREAEAGAPVAGVSFWAWAGEARPRAPGGVWRAGDPFVGDPPHEMQGWYSVYDSDSSTLAVISDFAARLSGIR